MSQHQKENFMNHAEDSLSHSKDEGKDDLVFVSQYRRRHLPSEPQRQLSPGLARIDAAVSVNVSALPAERFES
jgi:hypothetical protein